MMAGVVLAVMAVTGSGTAVRFIPRPVVIGFTNGIALVIASTQIKDFFGITLQGPVPGSWSRGWPSSPCMPTRRRCRRRWSRLAF